MAGKKKAVSGQVLAPRLSAEAAREIPHAHDVALFNRVLEGVSSGRSLRNVLAAEGLDPGGNLPLWVGRSPHLLAELKAAREGLREWNQFKAQAVVFERLEDGKEDISNRDLTDIIRATKPFDQASSVQIRITGLGLEDE